MKTIDRLSIAGVVPVVVLDRVEDAVPTAKALLAGGINVMEITFRTDAAAGSIRAVVTECPEMLVGAGTIINIEQCKLAAECGAKFIVSPGFDAEIVAWCIHNDIAVTPGCVTPSEIMAALKMELKILKFFPANVYGGLSAIKSLAGPFVGVKFIPTGGINQQNLGEFISSPYIHAVGGSWICKKEDIAAGNFEKITSLCKEARKTLLGYEITHVGINSSDADNSMGICKQFDEAFDFGVKEGNSSNFSTSAIEVMKNRYLGTNGHLAVKTNRVDIAIAELAKRGFQVDMKTAKYKNGRIIAVYLNCEIGGFAIHLLQK